MLKTILSVSGKPGLFKLASSGKNMVIVESLTDNKKIPIYARDKVVSLGDICIYTDAEEVPLKVVLMSIKEKEKGAKASIATTANPEELKKYLEEILPSFDRERVYPTDIKKLINWYNLLIESAIDFEKENAEGQEIKAEEPAKLEEAEKPTKEKALKEIKAEKVPKAKATPKKKN